MKPASTAPLDAAQARAGYHIPVNHFSDHQPPAGGHVFEAERQAVIDRPPHGPSRVLPLDRGPAMGLAFAATTPTMLACIAYVIRGAGTSSAGTEAIQWGPGDVFVLPADKGLRHLASQDALLFTVTDEPLWRYLGVQAVQAGAVGAVHYPADAIAREMDRLDRLAGQAEAVGRAVIFTRDGLDEGHLTTPFFIANINTLEAGDDQRTHRHNGAALTLSIDGEGCHSFVGEQRLDWTPFGVMVTPAGFGHSHHTRGPGLMTSLVVQDSGFYQYAGVPGFAFDPEADARHMPQRPTSTIAAANVGIGVAAVAAPGRPA